jgi:dTDP-4-amino-4,6-dideoxygalactose transaminase
MTEKIIVSPVADGGVGWSAIDDQEIEAVIKTLKMPENLFRYNDDFQDGFQTQCMLLEKELSLKTGIKHALFVASGTSALTLSLSAYGIGPGDEVIIPGYTYIATASAVTNAGAVPVIAEIDDSLSLDPVDAESKITPYTKAIIAVHMQGVPGRVAALRNLAKKHNLVLIEDACQAVGSTYQGAHSGANSHASAWSLNFYKILTCGEGGVFFCNDDDAFIRGVNAHDPGSPMWKSGLTRGSLLAPFTQLGVRGNEVCAAIARVQLTKLDNILGKTRSLKKAFLSHLAKPVHYKLQHVDDPEGDCGISAALIVCDKETTQRMSAMLNDAGMEIGSAYNHGFPDRHIYSYWDSILTKQGTTALGYPWADPSYKGKVEYSKEMCPVTLDLLSRSLRISIHLKLTEQNMIEFANAINYVDARL